MWQQKNKSSKVTSGNSRKQFPVDLEQEKMRGFSFRIKNALTIAGPVGEMVERRDQQSIKR